MDCSLFFRDCLAGFQKHSKKVLSLVLLTSASSLLAGCGDLNSQFTCPMKPGVTCQSLDQVNTMIDQGKLAQTQPHSFVSPAKMDTLTDQPHREGEQVLQLWIAPYQDDRGNYFSSSVVYHMIQPGRWASDAAHA